MGKRIKFVESAFICVVAAISLSLIINLALIACGIVPYNTADLGSSAAFVPYKGSFLTAYQNHFEQARVSITRVSNKQFPGYVTLLEADSAAGRLLNKWLYGISFGDGSSLLPVKATDNETIFLQKDGEYFIRILSYSDPEKLVSASMELINSAAGRNPGLSFGVYIVPSPYDNGVLSKAEPLIWDRPDYVKTALGLLDPGIARGRLEYADMYGYLEYFFTSDHHWNYTGAYRGYQDILKLMEPMNPSLGKPVPAGAPRVLDSEFRGSMARRAAMDIYDELYDFSIDPSPAGVRFMDADMSVREYDTAFPDRKAFLNGETVRYKYINSYALLFRNDFPMVTYDFGSATGRNLLLLGDSATNCMESLLASHYDITYSVDLRHYKSFRLDAFVRDHGITDVVFLYTSPALYTIGSSFRGMLGG